MSRQIGKASTLANSLKRAAFPSITGKEAAAPKFPKPKIALPSETTATVFPFKVWVLAAAGFLAIKRQTSATPGV